MRARKMKHLITKSLAIAAVLVAAVLFGVSVKDLAAWKISGLDSTFMLNASILAALLFSLYAEAADAEEPPSIVA